MKIQNSAEIYVPGVSPPFSLKGEFECTGFGYKLKEASLEKVNWTGGVDKIVGWIDEEKQLWLVYDGKEKRPAYELMHEFYQEQTILCLNGTVNGYEACFDAILQKGCITKMAIDCFSDFVSVKSNPSVYGVAENDFWNFWDKT